MARVLPEVALRPSHRWPGQTWRLALLGAAASLPASVALNWNSAHTGQFSLSGALVAGAIAGFLATYCSADPKSTGLRAGLLAAVPVELWFAVTTDWFVPFVDPASTHWLATIVVVLVFLPVVFVTSAIAGGICGAIGAWIARSVAEEPVRDAAR